GPRRRADRRGGEEAERDRGGEGRVGIIAAAGVERRGDPTSREAAAMTCYPPYRGPMAMPPGDRRPSGAALGFGIAALVLGTLGLLTICVPVVPLLIAGMGMVLALVGMAFSARRGGAAMPIIGAIVCAVPIVLVVGTYVG